MGYVPHNNKETRRMQSAIVEYSRARSRPCSQLPRERRREGRRERAIGQSHLAINISLGKGDSQQLSLLLQTPVALDNYRVHSVQQGCILHPGKRVGGLCGFGHWTLAAWRPLTLRMICIFSSCPITNTVIYSERDTEEH
ncbi:hypothetical protein I7I53_08738 [Histoplasma capsulatum var. duboisii H88]|uniref:Uncharacterized protein n=1 Tax=Ajellomyces capsulatus (strain H88) TaxID=544711 RepID=A0A8A1L9F6_AJEC8|nr:hypothetical protein I7I53_08738 [Histoplasma capsulatum var. duboisii H88]